MELLATEDHAGAGTAKGLVSRGRDDVGVGHGVGMQPRRDQPREVGHVYDQAGAHVVGDRPEALEVHEARVRRPAGHDQLGAMVVGERSTASIVDQARFRVDPVGDDVVQPARDIDLHPVGEVTAVGQLEPHERVAWVKQGHVDGGVGLSTRVGLDVGVLGAEQLLGAVDRQLLGDVDVLAAPVVALPRISLGVLVGQNRPLALEHRHRHEVLGGNHLECALLAGQLEREHFRDLRIDLTDGPVGEIGRQFDGHAVLDDTSGEANCRSTCARRRG